MSPLSSFPAFVPTSTAHATVTSSHLAAHHVGPSIKECDRCSEMQATVSLHPCEHNYCDNCIQNLLEASVCDYGQSMRLICLTCGQRVARFLPLPSTREFSSKQIVTDNTEMTQDSIASNTDGDTDCDNSDCVILPIKIDRSTSSPISLVIKPSHSRAPSTVMVVSPERTPSPPNDSPLQSPSYTAVLKQICRKFSWLTTGTINSVTGKSSGNDLPTARATQQSVPKNNSSSTPADVNSENTVVLRRRKKMNRTLSVPIDTVDMTVAKRRRRRHPRGKSYSVNACFEIMQVSPVSSSKALPGSAELISGSRQDLNQSAMTSIPADLLFELP